MYSHIFRKLAKEGLKQGEKVGKVDGASPVTIDGFQFILDSGKTLLEWLL